MALAYPAPGRLLSQATYDGTHAPVITYPSMYNVQPIIADGEYSDCEPLDDAQQFRIVVKYDASPTDVTTIEIATDPTFADAQTLDTIAAGTPKAAFWSSIDGVMYSGFIRINNTSDVQINSVHIQKQVSTGGGSQV